MKSDLEIQLENSTPTNLLSIDSIKTLLELYTGSFDELQEILENPLNMLDTDFLIEKYEQTSNEKFNTIRRELFKIHLEEIFTTFDNIEDSEEIYNKFSQIYEALGLSTENLKVVADIDKSINSEYINSSTLYKTKKGTRAGFFFVYDIINKAGIQAINADGLFKLIEGTEENPNTPYEYTIQTSLYREVFEKTIIPLAHPVGFNWNFQRLLYVTFVDYFGQKEIITLDKATLTCYGYRNKSLSQIEIINSKIFGELDKFRIEEDHNDNEKIIIDYKPLDGTEDNGLRLIRDFNNEIILYDRQSVKVLHDNDIYVGQIQYLDIDEIVLEDNTQGFLSINYVERDLIGEQYQAIESIDFKEYTIIDKPTVSFKFKLKDDKPNVWYRSTLLLGNKRVSDDIKYFNSKNFTRQDILDGSVDYNGRIEKNYGLNCRIDYKIKYRYELITSDISEYVKEQRPNSSLLSYNIKDIELSPEEMEELNNGGDPYSKHYSSVDHTVEETKYWRTLDFWCRMDQRALKPQPIIGQYGLDPTKNIGHLAPEKIVDPETGEITYIPDGDITDLVIGGTWNITNFGINTLDVGWNSNSVPERWEQYYQPSSEEDLALINSTTSVTRYIRDNLEHEGNTHLNNAIYAAWEDYTMDVYFNMFVNQDYCYDSLTGSWNINDGYAFLDNCLIIGSTSTGYKVDAEIYRSQWNYKEGTPLENKYEIFEFTQNSIFEDNVDLNLEESSKLEYSNFLLDDYSKIYQYNNIGEFDIGGLNYQLKYMHIGYEMAPIDNINIEEDISMFKEVLYCYNTFGETWLIGEEGLIGCTYIGSSSESMLVEADIYRTDWNFINDEDFEDFEFEVYRFNNSSQTWEIVEDNNVSAA